MCDSPKTAFSDAVFNLLKISITAGAVLAFACVGNFKLALYITRFNIFRIGIFLILFMTHIAHSFRS